jgi:hypothetical protein
MALLTGRNGGPLTPHQQRRAADTLRGMDPRVAFRYDEHGSTRFVVAHDDEGAEYGEIVFGPDILPGGSIIDPNSALSHDAAIAHELTHYHRWFNGGELPHGFMTELDEALTSLEAIARYSEHLLDQDIKTLAADAAARVRVFVVANRSKE